MTALSGTTRIAKGKFLRRPQGDKWRTSLQHITVFSSTRRLLGQRLLIRFATVFSAQSFMRRLHPILSGWPRQFLAAKPNPLSPVMVEWLRFITGQGPHFLTYWAQPAHCFLIAPLRLRQRPAFACRVASAAYQHQGSVLACRRYQCKQKQEHN